MKSSYKAYSGGKYLKQDHITEPEVVTVEDVREEEIAAPGEEAEKKLVVYFDRFDRGLVINMVNGSTLCSLSASENPKDWIGTTAEVYVDKSVTYGGRQIGGIRLRPPRATAKQPLAA